MSLEQLVPDIATLRRGYRAGEFTPAEVVAVLEPETPAGDIDCATAFTIAV